MSRLHDRLSDCVHYEITNAAAVMLWNHFAEKHSYECIHNMEDFDEIVDVDRSYRDVMNDLSHDFDRNAGYFYADSSDGTWASTDNPFVVIDLNLLVKDLIDSEGHGYPNVSAVDEYFDGYLFEVEMKETLSEFSAKELDAMAAVLSQYDYPVGSKQDPETESMIDDMVNALSEAKGLYSYSFVYLLPEKVQEKFFEFIDPDLDYLTENIGKKGPVPVERALNIAGFFKSHSNDNLYIQKASGKYHRYTIKIKNGAIKSAEPAYEKKQTACR